MERPTYMSDCGIMLVDYSTSPQPVIPQKAIDITNKLHSIFNEEELNLLFADVNLLSSFIDDLL